MYTAALLIFLIAIFGYSLTLKNKVVDTESMTSANQSLPWYVNTGTLIVTYFGSGALIGGAALAYESGYNAIWLYAGGWAAILLLIFLSDRMRKVGATTNSELLGLRFGEKTGLMASIIVVLSDGCLVAYNIRSTALVVNVCTGLDMKIGAILATIFIVLFTLVAGLISVAWTDYMQSLVIIVSIIIAVPMLIGKGGGWESVVEALPASFFQPVESFDIVYCLKNFLPTMCFVSMTSSYIQRFHAAKNRKELRLSVSIWFVGIVVITSLVMTFALVCRSMLETGTPDNIIMLGAKELLPKAMGLIMIVACCSILFTTADSFLLSASTVFLNDIYLKHVRKDEKARDDKHQMLVLRIAMVAIGIFAYVMISFFPDVLSMIYFAYTMEGGLLVLLLASFFWKRATPQAGFVCTIFIAVTTIVWEAMGQPFMPTIFATLIAAIVSLVVVTFLTPKPDPIYLERFRFDKKTDIEDA